MKSPTEFDPRASEPAGAFWTVNDLINLLQEKGDDRDPRSIERELVSQRVVADVLRVEDLQDEKQQSVKQKVSQALLESGRRKRKLNWFAQLHIDHNQQSCLAINDGRGHRHWLYIDNPESLSAEELHENLLTLLGEEAQRSIIWPHAALVGLMRPHLDSAERFFGLQTAFSAYYPAFDLLAFKDGMPRAQAPRAELSHLDRIEAEAIHIMREVAASAEKPVMLYSVGKDSAVMLHLARKAFYPSPPPFPLMHVDTTWKFKEMYQFRDQMALDVGSDLIVHTNKDGVERNINPFDQGSALHTEIMKTVALKQALDKHKFDVAFGGARRDEEKSRAKERVFSFRTSTHRWDPKNQRPELWDLYNTHKNPGESIRVFPISNWTELDIWQYIYREQIPIVPLYFARERPVVVREDGFIMMADDDRIRLSDEERIEIRKVRFRTLGCYPLTGAVESEAEDLASVILELLQSRSSERQGRAIDKDQSASMEKKKQEGYF
jgi:sulfate adenylyltransferase subunit 2